MLKVDIKEPAKEKLLTWDDIYQETMGMVTKAFIASVTIGPTTTYRGVCFCHAGLLMFDNSGIRHWDWKWMHQNKDRFKFERWTNVKMEAA